jgi:hypothetical protein
LVGLFLNFAGSISEAVELISLTLVAVSFPLSLSTNWESGSPAAIAQVVLSNAWSTYSLIWSHGAPDFSVGDLTTVTKRGQLVDEFPQLHIISHVADALRVIAGES